MNKLDINNFIRERRSVYPAQYSNQKIDDSIIAEMLENANWAPTHRLTEPWRFIVFSGKGLEKLGEDQAKIYKETAIENGNFDEQKFEKLRTKPTKASHVIAVFMVRDPQKKVPEIEEISSVAMAVQNIYLTASAHKIGCYWGTGGITYMEKAKEYFGIGEEDKFMGFIYLGNTDSPWPKGKREPIQEKVEWVR